MAKIIGGVTTTPINPKMFSGGSATLSAKIVGNILMLEQQGNSHTTTVKNNILVLI